ncbi:MAG: hypothetical protein WBQ75_17070 [Acetobacteraceae bacterium]
MRATALLIGAAVALLSLPASLKAAPGGTPARITGVVATFDGQTLSVAASNGQDVSITLPETLKVGAVADRTLADIKPGDFVGSAAVEGKDGLLHAQEVHIFPETMRGTGEGHRPMAGAEQTMTNAVVTGMASAPQGRILTLTYKGGVQRIEVGPNARIVALIPGDRGLLKPGAAVRILAVKSDDGKLTARSVQAEKDGVKPLS